MTLAEYKCLKADETSSTSVGLMDGRAVIVKETTVPETGALLENEYALLRRIQESGLPGAFMFPAPVSLEKGDSWALIRGYIPGMSLETLVEGQPGRPGLSRERAIAYALSVLERVRFLHKLQPPVIQRDIKPQNIIVDEQGECHIIDMGISRELTQSARRDTRVFGTPVTAPPEQFGYRQTDQRSDLYSVGVVLNYMLTGEYEPGGAELDRDVANVIKKATAFDPRDRYQSAEEMIRALRRLRGKAARPVRRPMLWGLLAALALSLFLILPRLSAGRGVSFREPLIEQAVRAQLLKPDGPLTREDLRQVESIHLFGRQVYRDDSQFWFLGDLPYCRDESLEEALWSQNGGITSLQDIALFPNLRVLCLYRQQLSDLSALRGMNIRELGIGYNPVTDLSPLRDCPALVSLNLAGIKTDPSAVLPGLPALRSLNLSAVPMADLKVLEGLPAEELNLFGTGPDGRMDGSAWASLSRMPVLRKLTVNKLDWKILEALSLSSVTRLEVTHANGIPFAALEGLTKMESLYFYADGGEKLEDRPYSFPALSWLDIKNVEMESLRCLSAMKALKTLHIYASTCRGYEGLEALPGLREIYCTPEQREALEAMYPDAEWTYR